MSIESLDAIDEWTRILTGTAESPESPDPRDNHTPDDYTRGLLRIFARDPRFDRRPDLVALLIRGHLAQPARLELRDFESPPQLLARVPFIPWERETAIGRWAERIHDALEGRISPDPLADLPQETPAGMPDPPAGRLYAGHGREENLSFNITYWLRTDQVWTNRHGLKGNSVNMHYALPESAPPASFLHFDPPGETEFNFWDGR